MSHFCYLIFGCSTLVLSPSALQLSPQVGCMWLLAWKRYTTNTFWSMYWIVGKGIPLNVGECKFWSCGPLLQQLNSVNKARKIYLLSVDICECWPLSGTGCSQYITGQVQGEYMWRIDDYTHDCNSIDTNCSSEFIYAHCSFLTAAWDYMYNTLVLFWRE